MNFTYKLVMLFLLLSQSIQSQNYYPPRRESVDTAMYNVWTNAFKNAFHDDSINQCGYCKLNVYKGYYFLKEPKDTIFKYINRAVDFDPAQECHFIYKSTYAFVKNQDAMDSVQWLKIKCRCDSTFALIDTLLLNTIKWMKEEDQKYRREMKQGNNNTEFWAKQNKADSINLIKMDSIVNKYRTYPGKNLVGFPQQNSFFLIVQHAPLSGQEKYLSLLKEAAKNNQMNKSNLCYITDRILSSKNLPQIYGTQLDLNKEKNKYELYKTDDLKNVDKRRSEMDLKPLREYLKENDVDYPEDK